MSFFNGIFGRMIQGAKRYTNGDFFYSFQGNSKFTKLNNYTRVPYVLNNPILLLVLKAKCDMFSLVKIDGKKTKGGETIHNYLHTELGNANYMQTWEQFLWEYCFWKSIGTAIVYSPGGDLLLKGTPTYLLNPSKVYFNSNTENKLARIIETQKEFNELMNDSLYYQEGNGTKKKSIKLSKVKNFYSTTNGLAGNYFEGYSMVDGITPILDNANMLLNTQHVNLDFSRKFATTKKEEKLNAHQINNNSNRENQDLEEKLSADRNIYAMNQSIDIKRFVDSIANLKLDEQQTQQYFLIGKAFGLSKDFLEASLKGSTYENKDKAFGQIVSQSLQPDIDQLLSHFEQKYGIEELKGSWNHLPFMYTFEKERQEAIEKKLINLEKAQQNGAKYTEAELKEITREMLNS